MHKEAKEKHFLKQPFYEGGPKAMKEFVAKNLRYPKEAFDHKIEGTVFVKYTIDHKGIVVEAKIVGGVGHGCDEEAIRVVKLFKFNVPKTRGIRVLYHKNIQIHFKLPTVQQEQPAAVQYNYVTTPKTTMEAPKENKGGYTITVNIASV